MRILMFGWEFPPYNSGGLGVACLGLTRALAAQDIQVSFVLPHKINVSAPFLKLIFADTRRSRKSAAEIMSSAYISSERYSEAWSTFRSPIYGRNLFEEVGNYTDRAAKIAEEEEFDIIHAHDWLTIGAGLEAKRVSGKPLVMHVHATQFDICGNNVDERIYQIEKRGMERADQIVAVSNYTKNIIVEKYGIDPGKIEVLWNGVEASDHQYNEKEENPIRKLKDEGYKVVLFMGRITMQKGPDYFLRAAKRVIDNDQKVKFIIAGSGDMEQQIIQQTAELGISDSVLFAGFVRGDDLNRLYRGADLYVLPSVSEPFGITVLESLINGTPVLISKQSGVAEALKNALKADFWDIDDMANKILSVIRYGSLQQTLGEFGKQEARGFTWQRAASKLTGFYNKIISLKKSS